MVDNLIEGCEIAMNRPRSITLCPQHADVVA